MCPSKLLLFCVLVSAAFSASSPAHEVSVTRFFGEDFHIPLLSDEANISFRPSIGRSREKPLMTSGKVVDPRAKVNSNTSHLILENVGESDEGIYSITYKEKPEEATRITLYVRDCSSEEMVKYGLDFRVLLHNISEPMRVGFRHSAVEANQTSLPAVEMLNRDGTPKEKYLDHISIADQKFTVHGVTEADEGSYTFTDSSGKVKNKICLNVKEHVVFLNLPYGGALKINLHLNSSVARLFYTPDSSNHKYLIMESDQLNQPPNLDFEGRLSLEDSVCVLSQLKPSDAGVFTVTDLQGLKVSEVHLKVKAYRLPNLYIAIIALVALLVLLLLVCLVSCLVKIRKRAAKARAIEKKAQSAGSAEGDAFRQVVKDACSRQNEEAPALSQKEDITEKSQSTEVSIKGLEVSTKEPSLQERHLETSDSGLGFNTSGLPLDSDTDAPTVPMMDAEVLTSSAAPALPNAAAPDPKTASVAKSAAPPPPPSPEPKPPVTPEPKLSIPTPTLTKPTLSPLAETQKPMTPDTKPTSPALEVKPAGPTPGASKAVTPTPEAISDAKPAVSPTPPEPKAAKVETPEQKPALSPTPVKTPDPKIVSPVTGLKPPSESPASQIPDLKPTTNGTPESKADLEISVLDPSAPVLSSSALDVKNIEVPATSPLKTPESGKFTVKTPELISSGGLGQSEKAPGSSIDGAATN